MNHKNHGPGQEKATLLCMLGQPTIRIMTLRVLYHLDYAECDLTGLTSMPRRQLRKPTDYIHESTHILTIL